MERTSGSVVQAALMVDLKVLQKDSIEVSLGMQGKRQNDVF